MKTWILNTLVAILDALGVACLCYGLRCIWPPLSYIAFGCIALLAAYRISKIL